MPLVLSLREGDDFYVSEQQFSVDRIYDETSFDLVRGDAAGEVSEPIAVTELQAVEIMPDVFVSAGNLFQKGIIRAVIDAPRDMLILRGDKYRSQETSGDHS
ncbi:hypothetical protein [Nitratireductor sp. OM-1]|uniref:hypothetical protein n=1 Tax=Nitratireductor sp. OM-1 TaxID=1756988 RepID=UPI000DDEB8C6|nr:hypothetical protein [Nitratireductor sp. OM-1]